MGCIFYVGKMPLCKKASNHHANLPWKCTVLHVTTWETPGNHWCWWSNTLIMTLASTRAIIKVSGHPVKGFQVFPRWLQCKTVHFRGRLVWWLLAFLCCVLISCRESLSRTMYLLIIYQKAAQSYESRSLYIRKYIRKKDSSKNCYTTYYAAMHTNLMGTKYDSQ